MRTIKFRAWTKGNDPLYHSDKPTMLTNKQLSTIGGYYYNFGVGKQDEYILMQYTGMKDRTGREIYEGDVVMDGDTCRIIEWSSNRGNTVIGYWSGFNVLDCKTEDIEVIGSIYENPELIKS